MKALGLLLLRLAIAVPVAAWAAARIATPEGGVPLLAARLPEMTPDALSIQLAGALGLLLALLVLLGFFRLAVYPAVVAAFAAAAAVAWPLAGASFDPAAFDAASSAFLLLAGLSVASLMLLVFHDEDRLALDRLATRRPAVVAAEPVTAETVQQAEETVTAVAPAAEAAPAPAVAEAAPELETKEPAAVPAPTPEASPAAPPSVPQKAA